MPRHKTQTAERPGNRRADGIRTARENLPAITIYTDGSALGNPGPGGYGAVLLAGPHRKELSQGYRLTTNNRMELTGVCAALAALRFDGSEVVIYSDSK